MNIHKPDCPRYDFGFECLGQNGHCIARDGEAAPAVSCTPCDRSFFTLFDDTDQVRFSKRRL